MYFIVSNSVFKTTHNIGSKFVWFIHKLNDWSAIELSGCLEINIKTSLKDAEYVYTTLPYILTTKVLLVQNYTNTTNGLSLSG